MQQYTKIRRKVFHRICRRCDDKFVRLSKYHRYCLDCMPIAIRSSFIKSIQNNHHTKKGMITDLKYTRL